MVDSIPNILLYKQQIGVCGGDLKDSLNQQEQKMSKCLGKLIKLFRLRDAFRVLHPHSRQF